MLALGRLYHESEMTAIGACGVGTVRIYRPILLLTVVVAAGLALLTFRVVPESEVRAQAIRIEALRVAQFGALEPGRFRSFAGGDAVFYAERVDRSGQLFGVFVQRRTAERLEIAIAERAEQRGAGQMEQEFILYDGHRYEGVPGSREWRVVEFREHGIPVRLPELKSGKGKAERKPTRELLASSSGPDRAELAWRIAVPIMALVLSVLAIARQAAPAAGSLCQDRCRDPRVLPVLEPRGARAGLDREGNARRATGPVVDAPATPAARCLVPVARRAPRAVVARSGRGGSLTCRRSPATSCGLSSVTRRSCCWC